LFSSAEKTNRTSTAVQQKAQQQTFFRKAGEESFFGGKERPSFFNAPIQAKLSISSPDDPQEKEADAVADSVMRMPDPSTASISTGAEEKLDKKEEEDIHPKTETPLISSKISCKEAGEAIQTKQLTSIFRMPGENDDRSFSDASSDGASTSAYINCKQTGLYHSDIIQRSGRGPPASSIPFEQSLSSSKGAGTALPGDTRQFMESRFNADFSGVRIHTGSTAQNMSSSIHAQAFAHGNDIYFNEGKFSPQTSGGATLLAHELTHTIQQGASPAKGTSAVAPKSIARKNIIQRSDAGVPVQLTNAVEKAKTVEGKIDANKPQADGFRTGWEHLVEIFKSTFGEDMVISGGGGTSVKGAVAEQDIKKKRETTGMIVDKNTVTSKQAIAKTTTGERDAMPSWCGIFTFWALNKSGVPMPKWKLGERMFKPEAARTPGSPPMPGDIAYRNAYSHYALVESATGTTVKTVNGNTAGEDNLGGQVQTIEAPLTDWTAFFNPLLVMTGSLGSGEGTVDEQPKTLAELRKEGLNINRKEETDEHESDNGSDTEVQAKTEMSSWNVDSTGHLNTPAPVVQKAEEDKELQKKEGEEKEEEKTSLSPVKSIQKKAADELDAENSTCSKNNCVPAAANKVQAKTQNENSSLKNNMDVPVQQNAAVQERGPPVQRKTSGADVVQCSVIDDALEYTGLGELLDCVQITDVNATSICLLRKASEIAMHIPGYKALRVVLSRDPITGDHVDRNGHNFLEAAFDIMPGGELLFQKLDEQHQLDAAAAWIDTKIADLDLIVNGLFTSFDNFWNGLGITDFGSPMQVLRDGANIVFGFIENIVNFAINAALELLEMVKQFLLDALVEFIKEHTTAYPLLTVILGEDPITKQAVDRNGSNILNALLELGGEEGRVQRDQMMETGTFEKIAAYIDEGISIFGNLYDTIVNSFSTIWDIITIDALMNPVETFTRIVNIFADPVLRVLDFVGRVVDEILKLIKEVFFKRISAEAKKVRGYFLMTVIIGKDPFTDEVVERSVENIIHGFMSLMDGGEEQFQQMKESGAIDKAVNKINAAVTRLNMTLESIIQLFMDLWDSFSFNDFLHPIETFRRIIATFGEPIGRLISFIVTIVRIIVEVILIIMNFPFDLINNIIAKAMLAFDLIKKDPIGFLKNLLRAIKEGFMQFFDKILTHLFNGLKTWFLGEVQAAGIPIPTDFTVMGIIKWLLEVLDITMEKIWKKLEERIGKPKVDKIRKMIEMAEKVASAAGEAYQFMKDVQERGFMAVMIDKVKEQLSNVWEMVLSAVQSFVMDQIISKVTTKLLSMLDPTGIMAVINSAIALYKAIQTFIKYLREMLEIVNKFVEGTLQIAQGATKNAADFLEGALASGIPIVIGFLANQVGLNLSERLKEALELVREKVDKALTWVIDKVVVIVEKLVSLGKAAVGKILSWLGIRKEFTMENGDKHTLALAKSGSSGQLMIESTPMPLLTFINQFASQPGLPAGKIQAANDARTFAVTAVMPVLAQVNASPEGTDTTALERQLLDKMVELTNKVRLLVGDAELLSNHVNKYLLEGAAGTFASIPKPTRDDMTADHIPQNGLFEVVMGLGVFSAGSPMDRHAANRTDAGYALNEQDKRHKAGRTWGTKGSITKANFRAKMNNEIPTKPNLQEKKNAIVEAIKTEKNNDITVLQGVYARGIDDPVWQDVKALPLKDEDKISLQTTIKTQANAGLTLLNSQNLDALKV
jgi:hypothetical protein